MCLKPLVSVGCNRLNKTDLDTFVQFIYSFIRLRHFCTINLFIYQKGQASDHHAEQLQPHPPCGGASHHRKPHQTRICGDGEGLKGNDKYFSISFDGKEVFEVFTVVCLSVNRLQHNNVLFFFTEKQETSR